MSDRIRSATNTSDQELKFESIVVKVMFKYPMNKVPLTPLQTLDLHLIITNISLFLTLVSHFEQDFGQHTELILSPSGRSIIFIRNAMKA